MRSKRYVFAACSALSASAAIAFVACGGNDDDRASSGLKDGATDALLISEVAPPVTDSAPPLGDVCGDRAGLSASSPWPLRGGCPTRAGWSGLGGPQTGALSWDFEVPIADSSPAIEAGGVVWVGTASGDVLAVMSGGSVRAALRTGAPVRSSAALDLEGNAVIAGGDGTLYGLRIASVGVPEDAGADAGDAGDAGDVGDAGPIYPLAKITFSISLGPMASSPVIGKDGTIYIGTLDGNLVAVATKGTAKKWSVTTNDTGGSSPAIGQDGTIYVGSSDHKLYAIRPDGTLGWALDLGAEIKGSPAVGGDGSVYIGSVDGKLHAVSSAGSERWAYPTGGPITGTPAVYGAAVYVGSEDKKLHAVSVSDGAKRWTYETLGTVGTPSIGRDGTVYVGSADARLYAITPKGTLFFAVNAKGKVRGAPAIAPGPTLYVTTDNGLVAVGP